VHPDAARVDWSIARRTSAGDCAEYRAASLRLTLYDSSGAPAGEWEKECAAFTTVVPGLAPDGYLGRAQLLDALGHPRTPAADLGLVDVVGGETVHVPPVDFAASSFE
jgi:hypothetical protein